MLEIDDRDTVRWLKLNRPDRMNALPPDAWDALRGAFEAFAESPQRVLVIAGEGGNFCAGADLGSDRGDPSIVDRRAGMQSVGASALALHRIPKPTIAVVDGVAVGAGMNLALGCDIVLASPDARFAEIFVRRGLTLDYGGSWILPRIVGLQRAKELALTGRMVYADEAVAIGLALEVIPTADLSVRADDLARELSAQSPVGQMFAKQNLNAAYGISLAAALELEAHAQSVCLQSQDAAEGVAAFVAKRAPEFEGR